MSDSNYVKATSQKLDPQKTVFVGALHGMLNAEGLFNIMTDLFGGVVYAGTVCLMSIFFVVVIFLVIICTRFQRLNVQCLL